MIKLYNVNIDFLSAHDTFLASISWGALKDKILESQIIKFNRSMKTKCPKTGRKAKSLNNATVEFKDEYNIISCLL